MRIITFFLLGILAIPGQPLKGQGWEGPAGAAYGGMTVRGISTGGLFSGFVNPAGLSLDKQFTAGLVAENRFIVPDLTLKGLALQFPAIRGMIGLTGSHFGNALYSEQRYNLAYALQLARGLHAGISLDYCLLAQGNGYGSRGAFTFGGGIIASLTEDLQAGLYVFNPLRVTIESPSEQHIPVWTGMGLTYRFSPEWRTWLEVTKSEDHTASVQTGGEYLWKDRFALRAGISAGTGTYSFGAGFQVTRFRFDIAMQVHPQLGICPQAGIQYDSGKR